MLYSFSDRLVDGKFVDENGNSLPTSQLAAQKANKQIECGACTLYYIIYCIISLYIILYLPSNCGYMAMHPVYYMPVI